jgi:SAM-dependent methyltransferase
VHNPRLIRGVMDRYGVGEGFAEAYLDFLVQPGGRHSADVFASVEELLALPQPDVTWVDYALSTNQRGRDLCARILRLPQLTRQPKRYLDVGCGFGGLLAAFAERGCEVHGIDVDPERVQLARANCRDHGRTDAEDVIRVGDILDDAFVSGIGQFDVITMVDVIEHVLDVPRTLSNVVGLLNPGGLVLLEIPNRHSLRFVARDGHFSLFGITLLEREAAIRYHGTMFSFPYDVGDYFELGEYRRRFESLGCAFSLVEAVPAGADRSQVPGLLQDIQACFAKYLAQVRPKLPPDLDATLQVSVAEYTSQLAADYRDLLAGRLANDAFETRYLADFWRVSAVKNRI